MSVNTLRIFISFFITGSLNANTVTDIAQKMIDAKLVPDLMRHPPNQICQVVYQYGEVYPGEEWLHNRTADTPHVTWAADPNAHYCLYFTSLNRFDENSLLYLYTRPPTTAPLPPPSINTAEIWVMTNIPGNDLTKGKTILSYSPPQPPMDAIVRLEAVEYYVFLIYKQPVDHMIVKEVEYENSRILVPDTANLTKFEIDNDLGKPVAGNFFILTGKDLYRRPNIQDADYVIR